jgi:hypothetical protein
MSKGDPNTSVTNQAIGVSYQAMGKSAVSRQTTAIESAEDIP